MNSIIKMTFLQSTLLLAIFSNLLGAQQNGMQDRAHLEPKALSAIPGVSALGRLEPRSRIRRVSPWAEAQSAVVAKLLVAVGDIVASGQVIAILDNQDQLVARLQVSEARAHVAKAKYTQILAGVDPKTIEAKRAEHQSAQAKLNNVKHELKRATRLMESGVLAVQDFDRFSWRFEEAVFAEARLQHELASLERVRAVDIDVARAELASANAEVQRYRTAYESSHIRSPIDGTVLRILTREGERVGSEGLLELGDVAHMQAVAEVFEADVHRVRPGMQARIEVLSTGIEFNGWVVDIGRLIGRQSVHSVDPVSDVDARVIEVRLDLDPMIMNTLSRLSNARVLVSMTVPDHETDHSFETKD